MKLSKLLLEQEPTIEDTLTSLSKVVSKLGFINDIFRVYQYNDEPKIFHYCGVWSASKKNTDGDPNDSKRSGGVSFFSKEEAFIKCYCESIERYASASYRKSELLVDSYYNLKEKALNPEAMVNFSKEQKEIDHFKNYIFNEKTRFNWTKGYSLIDGKEKFIPAQLIYFNYKFSTHEKRIYIPITTGTAGGGCLSAAIVRGILEIVERDAFMIYYLNKLPAKKVKLGMINDSKLKNVLSIFKRYRLEVHVMDLTTDLNIPTFLSIIIDKKNLGPALVVGLKSSLDPVNAIIGSLEEAISMKSWMRNVYEENYKDYKNTNPSRITSVEERAMYWYKLSMLKNMDFWINQEEKGEIKKPSKKLSSGEQLKVLLDVFKRASYDIYFKDITLLELKTIPYKIVKVIIPTMQPLYLQEQYKYLGGDRLYNVPVKLGFKKRNLNRLNHVPHPFL